MGRIPCIDISWVSILGVFRLRACQHHGGRISPGAALNMTDGKVRLPLKIVAKSGVPACVETWLAASLAIS